MRRPDSFLLLSLASLGAGLFLSWAHPLVLMPLFFIGAFLVLLWQPRSAVLCLPLLLPILDFSPWTGWLMVDEFDLLVLAVVAAGYFHIGRDGARPHRPYLFLAIAVLLVARGANGLVVADLDWFAGYFSPQNSLRVGKTLLWVVLLSPLLAQAGQASSRHRAGSTFFGACLIGSCGVILGVLWERNLFPGLFDMSTPYRTVALFWEMHLGGAALDAYLVLISPLLVWAWRATIPWERRLALGAFILVFVYVCLTTYSRGVWGAIAGNMVVLGVLLAWHPGRGGPQKPVMRRSGKILLALVALEIGLVLGAGSFMSQRVASTEIDLGGRLGHWRQGLGLLKTSGDWLLGIGLGQLPTRLTQGDTGLARPGAFRWHQDGGLHSLRVSGPEGRNGELLSGLYAVSQRVDLVSRSPYRLVMELRSETDSTVMVKVCALHLLFPGNCQIRAIGVTAGGWRRIDAVLSGAAFGTGFWQGMGHGVFLLSVLTPGGQVEITHLQLSAGDGNLLRNAGFEEQGLAWFPFARAYFLPWHIDNLYLEILIESGTVGLLIFLALMSSILVRLFRGYRRGNLLAVYFISCILGLLALGLVVSVFDMPRVATLFGLFLVLAWHCPAPAERLAFRRAAAAPVVLPVQAER